MNRLKTLRRFLQRTAVTPIAERSRFCVKAMRSEGKALQGMKEGKIGGITDKSLLF